MAADTSTSCKEAQKDEKKILLLVSGKRKCGKDHISQLIQRRLGDDLGVVLHISAPLKREYAEMANLDYHKLLDSSAYKEVHRANMVKWGEQVRRKDASYFCQKTVETAERSGRPIWIVADIRRKTDIEYFNQFEMLTLRLQSSNQVRSNRGWVFTEGIDDSETEVDLDDYLDWDFIISNNDNNEALDRDITEICSHLRQRIGLTFSQDT